MQKTGMIYGAILTLVIGQFLWPSFVHAEKSIADVQKERQEIKDSLSEKEKEIADFILKIDELKAEIQELDNTMQANKDEIDKVETDISEIEKEIEEIEERIEKRTDILKKRAQSYQENGGNIGYLDVLFDANTFHEFISRVSAVTTITDADAKLIEEQEKDKRKVEEKLADLEDLREELEMIQENMKDQKENKEAKKEDVQAEKEKLSKLVHDLEMKDDELSDLQSKLMVEEQHSSNDGDVFAPASISGNGEFGWPTEGGYISSPMGKRWGKMHKGIDIARTDRSTKPSIFAAESGVVESAGFNNGGYGNMVIINHGNGVKTLYGHMSSIKVSNGQQIKRGQKIGVMGETGNSKGIHLHFEVHINGNIQNPVGYLQ